MRILPPTLLNCIYKRNITIQHRISRFLIQNRLYSPPAFKSSTDNTADRSLNLTDSAVKQLQVLRQKFPEKRLRVAVEAGGCHGFQYKFQLDQEEPTTEDITFKSSDSLLQVICDKISWNMIKDAKLDYTQELIGSAFRIVDNPVADSGCGCGISFDLKSNK